MKPYTETRVSNDRMLREFSEHVSQGELEWHMDRRSRRVTIKEGWGWKLQLESGLPFEIRPGETYFIPKESWHRLLRGNGKLRIVIDEE
jgi:quercetin dioxygenase-like cupin family protein